MLRIYLKGLSGQGVETASYLIGTSFLMEGYHPLILPGSLIKEIGSPIHFEIYILEERKFFRDEVFDVGMVLKEHLYEECREKVKEGGIIIVNSKRDYKEKNKKVYSIDLSSLPIRILGKELLSTSALGALSGILGVPRLRSCIESIRKLFKGTTLQKNIEIFEKTYETARKMVI